MANSYTGNPIILDTVWTSGTIPAALAALTSAQLFSLIKWVNPTAAGDECKITDLGGNVLFDEFADVAHKDVVLWDAATAGRKYQLKEGGKWILATLTAGGKLYLYK